MNRLFASATLLCFSFVAMAGQPIDQSLDAAKDGYVKIEHVNGQANIRGWDKTQVKVVGELGARTDKFIFERDGNEVIIKVKVKNHRGWDENWNSDEQDKLDIFVPFASKVSYSAVNADVDASEINGGTNIETVNGNIEVKQLAGRIWLESVNGNISAQELSGDLKIETVNGNIKSRSNSGKEDRYNSVNGNMNISSDSPEMRVETVNGNVKLNLSKIMLLSLDTVNGDYEVRMNLQQDAEVRASSVGGSISLYFQDDVSARFDIQGHAGGNIINKLSDDRVQKNKYGPSRWLEFSHNGGKARVDISTVSGRISLDHK